MKLIQAVMVFRVSADTTNNLLPLAEPFGSPPLLEGGLECLLIKRQDLEWRKPVSRNLDELFIQVVELERSLKRSSQNFYGVASPGSITTAPLSRRGSK